MMKFFKKSLLLLTVMSMFLPTLTLGLLAEGDSEIKKTKVNATISEAYGGATSIATMTFDDGLMPTAQLLNQLCEEYGLRASLMLISDYLNRAGQPTVSDWQNIFKDGYLAPESHSANHEYIVGEGHPNYSATNNTPENISDEIVGSFNALNAAFPSNPVLTYAVPYSTYTKEAMAVLMETYYSARLGSCVLSTASYAGKMQTLDPKHTDSLGGWYNPYMVRMQANVSAYSQTNSVEALINYLTQCVNNNGWFISICHGITPQDNSYDTTEAQMREIMAAMKRYQDMGLLWVTSYGDATRYVRERQNSTVEAYSTDEGLFVDLTMSEKTKEGLDLSADIFNHPLTVKVEMPDSWRKISYVQGNGESKEIMCKKEGGVNFAYIDLIPNGGTAEIKNEGDPTEYVKTLNIKQNVSADTSLSYSVYVPANSKVAGVYVGKTKLSGIETDDGYVKYTVDSIKVTDVSKEIKITLKFTEESGYTDYDFVKSVVSYFDDLVESTEVTESDKQLAFDFLVFARATVIKFTNATSTDDIDAVIAKLRGFTSTQENAELNDLGTVTNVLTGAAFAINEKPYYVFYIVEGFTGKITFTYSENKTVEYDVVNGYYHCKQYLILEIENVYELADVLTISATGEIGEVEVTASGSYSMSDYLSGLTVDGNTPEYESALYSYALSAKNYKANG